MRSRIRTIIVPSCKNSAFVAASTRLQLLCGVDWIVERWFPLPSWYVGKVHRARIVVELRVWRRKDGHVVVLETHVCPPILRVDHIVSIILELKRI